MDCSKCKMPLNEKNTCKCTTESCCHCCGCDDGCECGCK